MAGKVWTKEEENIIIDNYYKSSKEDMIFMLPKRTWDAIKIRANKLGIYKDLGDVREKNADLSLLLNYNNPQTCYWIGFLLADGTFRPKRIKLTLAEKDKERVIEFASFLRDNRKVTESSVSYMDYKAVPKIIEDFSISSNKTYVPVKLPKLKKDCLFALYVGFIDGDGCIDHQYGRHHDFKLRVKLHSSWIGFLEDMKKFFVKNFGEFNSKVKINNQGYAQFVCTKMAVLTKISEHVEYLGLNVMARKWNGLKYQSQRRKKLNANSTTKEC